MKLRIETSGPHLTLWQRTTQTLPWLVLIVGLAITYFLQQAAVHDVHQAQQTSFDFQIREIKLRIEQRLSAYKQILQGAKGLFAASKSVERNEFHDYVTHLNLLTSYPGIQSIGFSLIIPPQKKTSHIEAIRKKGFPDYSLHPKGERSLYTSYIYMEPINERNLRAFGYDPFAETVRRIAMEQARDLDQVTISGKVILMQETDQHVQAGFLMFLPIYHNHRPHTTTAERRANIFGWVVSSFRMDDLMLGILGERSNDIELKIFDGENATPESLMYDSSNKLPLPQSNLSTFQRTLNLDILGHPWTIQMRSLPVFEAQIDQQEVMVTRLTGTLISVLLSLLVWQLVNGRAQAISLAQNMTVELQESEGRFRSTFNFATIGMALIAIDGRFLQVNSAICKIFGYSENELLKYNLQLLTLDNNYDSLLGPYMHQLLSGELPSFQTEVECRHKIAGKILWVLLSASLVRNTTGEPQYYIIQVQDITARKFAEQQLIYIANHDPLTGLLNRVQFHDRFTQTLSSAQRHETKLALLFLDLDRFKLINDTLGHRIGDLLLQAVSERLKRAIRNNDLLARLGGDEFILLLNDINDIDDVARIAQKIIDNLTLPFPLEGIDIVVTASVGISVYPDDGDNSHTLMMNADTAMYLAKERGKNNYQFYTSEMTARSLERMSIERDLRHALTHYELKLHYQPQIDSKTGFAVRAEALVRWQHPDWGLVYPERFIDVAEETGLIVPIGLWVLRTACLQVKAWQDHDGPVIQVAVNVSARQFLDPNLFQSIKDVLAETGVKPSSLELEITESAVMQDSKRTLQVLQQLHELGVRLSIDDFGTGYSSLTILRQFPVHSVKIDRSFIRNIPDDEGSMTLVRAIIALAHELNLDVSAEGVENEAQLAFLKNQQCDMLQGYIFSKALPAKQLETDFDTVSLNKLFSRNSE